MEYIWTQISGFALEQANHNDFFKGGAMAAALGFGIAWLRGFPRWCWEQIRKWILVSGKINNTDDVWQYQKMWMWRNHRRFWSHNWLAQTIRLPAGHKNKDKNPTVPGLYINDNDEKGTDIVFLPAPGRHFFFEGWRLFWLDVSQTEPKDRMDGNKIYESCVLWTFGKSPAVIRRFFADMQETYRAEWKDDTVDVYVNQGPYWEFSRNLVPRKSSSVFIRDGLWEDILDDARAFLEGREWYADRSIPWRRGFLFHGVAGSGKTTVSIALASELRLPIYVVNLNSTNDSTLSLLLSKIDTHALVLMEDIDSTSPKRNTKPKDNDDVDGDRSLLPGLTLSGLLNALDGAVAGEGRIVCMTTNHPDQLDPALIRPGRVDRRIEIGVADAPTAARFLATFYCLAVDTVRAGAELFAGMPMAEIQEHCLRYRDSFVDAILSKGRETDG